MEADFQTGVNIGSRSPFCKKIIQFTGNYSGLLSLNGLFFQSDKSQQRLHNNPHHDKNDEDIDRLQQQRG